MGMKASKPPDVIIITPGCNSCDDDHILGTHRSFISRRGKQACLITGSGHLYYSTSIVSVRSSVRPSVRRALCWTLPTARGSAQGVLSYNLAPLFATTQSVPFRAENEINVPLALMSAFRDKMVPFPR